jgi:outer membrane immunogenic protein
LITASAGKFPYCRLEFSAIARAWEFFMKKLTLAISILSISAASVFAADLPARMYTKAPAVMVYDWSGFYIGANGGWGSSRNCWDLQSVTGVGFVGPISEGCHNATGGLAGGQIGYRWQTGAWVFGVEGQGDWANLRGSNLSSPQALTAALTNQTTINAFGMLVGKAGYAMNNALFYVNSGVAVTSSKFRGIVTGTSFTVDTANEVRLGYAAGAGIEYGFAPNWSAAVEYDHFFMDQSANDMKFLGVTTRTDTMNQDVDLVTVRLNYHFGGGAVVAKY